LNEFEELLRVIKQFDGILKGNSAR